MRLRQLLLALILAATVIPVSAQERFGADSRRTDIIVKVEPGTVEMPTQASQATIEHVAIRVPEVSSILSRFGATEILRSFPDASPADTLLFTATGEQVRLIDRTQVFRFRFPNGTSLADVVKQLTETRSILFAYEIPEYQFFSTPNDVYFSRQWNLHHTAEGVQPPITSAGRADVRAVEAWNLYKGYPATSVRLVARRVGIRQC